jgi:Helix-turn-helix domain
MGGPGSGPRSDAVLRARVAELRARGLGLREIGRRLGLHPEQVRSCLRVTARASSPAAPCPRCGGVAIPAGAGLREDPGPCPACLAKQPRVRFGDVLRAHRLAAGLTRAALSRRAGVDHTLLLAYEQDGMQATWPILVSLVRVLGAGLVTPKGKPEGRASPRRRAKGGSR